jgi:hypothetical protein
MDIYLFVHFCNHCSEDTALDAGVLLRGAVTSTCLLREMRERPKLINKPQTNETINQIPFIEEQIIEEIDIWMARAQPLNQNQCLRNSRP